MVTKSTINYKKWKKEVREHYSQKFGKEKGRVFMNYVSKVYDKHDRSFLPHKVLWRCFDLHKKVIDKNQHQVYGAFGRGGAGKSTLIKNILYFHDPTFSQDRIASSMDEFIIKLGDVLRMKNYGKFKAILIDEPSKTTHQASLQWRMTEDVLGQIRQANLFIGVCSTELRNVKSTLYSMITGLFAFTGLFVYDYYDEEKTEGICGNIIKEYKKTNTYEVFNNKWIRKKAYFKNIKSCKQTPLEKQQKKYELQKRKEFLRRVDNLRKFEAPKEQKEELDLIDKLIIKKRRNNLSIKSIAEDLEVTESAISQRIKKIEKFNVYLIK